MSFYNILLFFHVTGAAFLGVVILFVIYALMKNISSLYASYASTIAVGTCIQIITGSLLTLVSTERVSLVHYCSKIGVYFVVLITSEVLLYLNILKVKNKLFPFQIVTSSLTLSLLFRLFTVFRL